MTIREKVALVIAKKTNISCGAAWDFTDPIITAFLAAAAEPDEETGISWHMRPDVATETMLSDHQVALLSYAPVGRVAYLREAYRAMLAAAPEFEWGQ